MRRVVVTGLGVVAPGAVGTKEFWSLLTAGRTATRAITLFDPAPYRSRIAAEAAFDPAEHHVTPDAVERLDRAAQFALVSAREAIADSGLDRTEDPLRTGVALGSAAGCVTDLSTEYAVVSDCGSTWHVDHTRAVPHLLDCLMPSSLAAEVALDSGAQGPVTLLSNGCTAGLDSIGHAAALIREDSADVMIAGGTEAPVAPIPVAAFDALKVTSRRNDEPRTASRPFDRTRDGFVLGEGSAVLILEEFEHARRRGARMYAEIAGFARRSSAYHMTGLRPGGHDLARTVRAALDQARIDPGDVDYINAHGAGTRQNDLYETEALKRSFGSHAYRIPVSSIASMIGHALGAAGSLGVCASALVIEHGVVPPTANLRVPDPACDLDYTPLTAREQRTDTVLGVGSGFGGFHSAVLLTRPRPAAGP
ncbi:act minimal PKS ketosynthase (KS/KS alpha) [Streptomyces sp. SLBN-118]|uniref:beta-ketoacyl-[acyl-carrier-protein] synthase family protein n=1 Tax=Streptomyces sp. SLBN-118 TaxID=2768454 RepID=UPI00114F1A9E|nr:beta-ketoacyl-[acyl-carrier-protein] synthase family protein [Streptomyces sp. SLBN-118]TQK50353.1 act minimal PKS ketosynthase (KS/KS alpha) [Streptomyces sp. SLBN-118]